MKQVTIYTDGSSRGNPGPGGYGTVLIFGKFEKKISQGYECTTNNRMEIMAALAGLKALKEPCEVTIYSDSKYLVNALTEGWMEGWKRNGWAKKKKSEVLKNVDLWKEMDAAIQGHIIHWKWVKGHAGNKYNEICDQLATEAADGDNKVVDVGFVPS
ncbi:MAG: ribonuclease HI [Verrucomicrobiales bacterium]|nr:ribonuclease HI [Verrucomicrobiales bacterium]